MITTRHKLTRYGTSLAVVLGVHAIAIAIALHWSAPRTVQLPPAAMVIDLAPMPAPPPPAPPKVVTPPQPPAPVEELPLPKLAEAPKPTIQVPKPVKPTPGPSPQQVAAKASWEGALLAHRQKYKKYPQSALNSGKEGMNRLRFVVDAQGNVLSYELVGRSGNANLDRATLDMIRNAQPLPKPPADMVKSGSIEIVAPFVYNIEKRRR